MGSPEITARQVAEAALREREAELARVQRIGRVGGFEIDLRDGQFASRRSPEYLEVHGLPPDAVDNSHDDWVRRLHPDDRERAEAQFKACVTDGASHYASEYRIIVPGQGTRWIAASGEIERDTTGAPLRMIGVHIDITRTKAAEAALRASEARLREVLDAIGEAFYTLNSAERFTNVSRRALEIWGVAADDLLGRRMSDVLPNVAQDAAYAAVRQSMVSGRHSRTEAPMATLGGRWAEQDAYPTGDGGVAVAFRDVHDRKRIELALKESEQRLRELNEQLERLANERARQLASSRAQLQAFFDNSPDWLTLQRCTPDGRFDLYRDQPGLRGRLRHAARSGGRAHGGGDPRPWTGATAAGAVSRVSADRAAAALRDPPLAGRRHPNDRRYFRPGAGRGGGGRGRWVRRRLATVSF